MTVLELKTVAKSIRSHAIPDATIMLWIKEIEATIHVYVRGESEYNESLTDITVLSVPLPYSRLYVWYLVAMIDLAICDYEAYQNDIEVYNAAFDDYSKYYVRTHRGK